MANNRVGGTLFVTVDGKRLSVKGEFSVNPGADKREGVVGQDGVHGYKETPQIAFVEGAITVRSDTDLEALQALDGGTVLVQLGNQKDFALYEAWWAGEGTLTSGEGEMTARFEGKRGEYL